MMLKIISISLRRLFLFANTYRPTRSSGLAHELAVMIVWNGKLWTFLRRLSDILNEHLIQHSECMKYFFPTPLSRNLVVFQRSRITDFQNKDLQPTYFQFFFVPKSTLMQSFTVTCSHRQSVCSFIHISQALLSFDQRGTACFADEWVTREKVHFFLSISEPLISV